MTGAVLLLAVTLQAPADIVRWRVDGVAPPCNVPICLAVRPTISPGDSVLFDAYFDLDDLNPSSAFPSLFLDYTPFDFSVGVGSFSIGPTSGNATFRVSDTSVHFFVTDITEQPIPGVAIDWIAWQMNVAPGTFPNLDMPTEVPSFTSFPIDLTLETNEVLVFAFTEVSAAIVPIPVPALFVPFGIALMLVLRSSSATGAMPGDD